MKKRALTYHQATPAFGLDLTQTGLTPARFAKLHDRVAAAHLEMQRLEAGAIKNPDENRRVTHFTDRRAYAGSALFAQVEDFFAQVRAGTVRGAGGQPFDALIVNGIGGSALGPQLVQFALRGPYWNEWSRERRGGNLRLYFTDNTDSAGLADILAVVDLRTTLTAHVSKSGGTRETRNNLLAIEAAYAQAEVPFAPHATAVTMAGSQLDQHAKANHWLAVWPMADSIGGRTSETAIVGHVPAAAAGLDFAALLRGACTMDEWTRAAALEQNPAYLLAASWYLLGRGRGDKNMVIVPYADRLVLLSRYLQQLVMESLGKELDRAGHVVHQGLTVFGNKGGTDAHAFIQQLNDGRHDFFVTFIEVLKDAAAYDAGGGLQMGDCLHNFLQGLSDALAAKKRSVIRLTIGELTPEALGLLIALYERAVAVYAELINVNAFHQPGVQAYKKASEAIDALSLQVQQFVAGAKPGWRGDARAVAKAIGATAATAAVAGLLAKFAANDRVFGGKRLRPTFTDGRWRYQIG